MAHIRIVRDRILKQDKGDRAFIELLLMARALGDVGLETLEVARDLTLQIEPKADCSRYDSLRRMRYDH